LWKHVVEDQDSYVEGLDVFQDEILPNTRRDSKNILIKGVWMSKPKEITDEK